MANLTRYFLNTTERDAYVVTQGDVDQGLEAFVLGTGRFRAMLAAGASATAWQRIDATTPSKGFVSAITSIDNEIVRFNGTSGQVQGYTSGGPTIGDTGIVSGALVSGTYVPVLVTGTNVTAGTLAGWWHRVGSVVKFGITGSVTHTNGAPTASAFSFNVPVASNFAATTDLSATVSGAQVSLASAVANATDNDCDVAYTIAANGAQTIIVTGQYTVI